MKTVLKQYMEMLDFDGMPNELKKYLNCPSLVRLKNVGYFCGMDYASREIYQFDEYISRYDHSLTVALLTWKLTRDLRTTLAGLFHDISSPCFSHVIDYMNKDYDKQESTEEKTEEIIMNDKCLLGYLKEDNIDVNEIINFKNYSIVDLDRPMLCADRLDGIILTGIFWTKSITVKDAEKIISNINVFKNEDNNIEIGFVDMEIANLVLETGKIIDVYCHSKEDNYMMELLAKIVKIATNLNLINYDDLFVLNEKEVLKIFDMSNDIELMNDLLLFRNIKLDEIIDINIPNTKIRKLNPIVLNKRLKSYKM